MCLDQREDDGEAVGGSGGIAGGGDGGGQELNEVLDVQVGGGRKPRWVMGGQGGRR